MVTKRLNLVKCAVKGTFLAVTLPLFVAVLAVASYAQQARISGRVLDSKGNPVSGAKVTAMTTGAHIGMVPAAVSDAKGQFVINGLAWGEYTVAASKKQSGYPPEDNPFYTGQIGLPSPHIVVVSLDSKRPQVDVTVTLGHKAGVLFGTITDAVTGKRVDACSELHWKEKLAFFVGNILDSKFRVLVPADTDLTLVVWYWGYQPWFFDEHSKHPKQKTLRVGTGQKVHLDVRLTPSRDNSQPPTDEELKTMRDSLEVNGCNAPRPERIDVN